MKSLYYLLAMLIYTEISCNFFIKPREYTFDQLEFTFDNKTSLDTSSYYFHDYHTGSIHIICFDGSGNLGWLNCKGDCEVVDSVKLLQFEWHRYMLNSDSIKLEIYEDSYHGFTYWEGMVYPDSIVFTKYKNRNDFNHLVYQRMK